MRALSNGAGTVIELLVFVLRVKQVLECHHRLNSILLIKRVKKQKPNKMSWERPAQPTSSTLGSSCELKTDKDYQNDRPFSNDK